MRKTQVIKNKSVYLGMSLLDLRKIVMYEFLYDWVKRKYVEKGKLCYVDTDSFIVHIKTDDIYKDIAEDVETKVDNYNNEHGRPLPKGKNQKSIGLIKAELGGKIPPKIIGLRAKAYCYLIDHRSEDKKEKGTKSCIIKRL